MKFSEYNDWEPAIAADPSGPYIYALTSQYGGKRACTDCPRPIVMRISQDNGATWGEQTFLCTCKGEKWQADPQIRVDAQGKVFAAWLSAGYDIFVASSEDHGETWSKPVSVIGDLAWGDHEWLTVAPNGTDVYVGFNKVDSYMTTSHDGGKTWSEPVMTNPKDSGYYFHQGGVVLADGSIVTTATTYGCCPYGQFSHKRPMTVYVIRSQDEGKSWEQIRVDQVAAPPICKAKGCPKAQYGALPGIATDEDDDLVIAYNGGDLPHGGEQLWVRSSTDGGTTWSERKALSPPGDVIAAFPSAVGTGDGDFRVTWTDDREGATEQDRWNVYFSRSADGGRTWSEAIDISDGTGEDYQHEGGFQFYYGDYGDLSVTNEGATVATWGEAVSYNGPGSTWINVEE